MDYFATKPKWNFRDAAKVVLVITCLILAVNAGIILVNFEEIFAASSRRSLITLLFFLVQEAIFLSPLYYLIFRKYKLNSADFGFRKIAAWPLIKWLLKAYGIVFLFNILLSFVIVRLGKAPPGFEMQESHIPLFGESPVDLWIAVVVLVGLAPIIEEIVFRGFLLQTLLARFKPLLASALTAGIFAALHFEFQSIGIILLLSFVLNWIFMRSRSLWPCIVFHMINNGLAFLVEYLIWIGFWKL